MDEKIIHLAGFKEEMDKEANMQFFKALASRLRSVKPKIQNFLSGASGKSTTEVTIQGQGQDRFRAMGERLFKNRGKAGLLAGGFAVHDLSKKND